MSGQIERVTKQFPQLPGAMLTNIRAAATEMVLSFSREGQDELHLICKPEGHVITGPDGAPIPHITGMKYEIGTGPLVILEECRQLAGEAYEIIGQLATAGALDPKTGVFGIQFGAYSLVISHNGLRVLHTRELAVDFQRPLVTQ